MKQPNPLLLSAAVAITGIVAGALSGVADVTVWGCLASVVITIYSS